MMDIQRREFLAGGTCGALAVLLRGRVARADTPANSVFATRGVVQVPEDLTLTDWPQRAKAAGLTTIGLHHQNSPQAVIRCVQSDAGQRFLEQCRKLGLQVEYELHAMPELLPRELFAENPEMFRRDDQGQPVADFNCCVHSDQALEIICANAVEIVEVRSDRIPVVQSAASWTNCMVKRGSARSVGCPVQTRNRSHVPSRRCSATNSDTPTR